MRGSSPHRLAGGRGDAPPLRARPWCEAGASALLLVAACTSQAPHRATTIRIAHESEALSLDPVVGFGESVVTSLLSNSHEGLVALDKDMSLVPALAVSWHTLDERTWEFELRPGVQFHDGRLVGADDVHASIERARSDPASGLRGHVSTIESVQVISPMVLRIRTATPDPLLLNRLAYVLVTPRGSDPQARPVGTGPYRFVRWERGKPLELEAFPGYWGGRPGIDHVSVLAAEGSAAVEMLRKGDLDVFRYLPESQVDVVRGLPGMRVEARSGLTSYYLWFGESARGHPFADPRVRRAASLAIDREEIVRTLGGHGVAAGQFVQPGVFGYVSGLPPLAYDPGEARRLMRQAGFASGFDVTLVHRSQPSVESVARLVRNMLGRVGIRVRLETPDWGEVVSGWKAGRIPFFLAGWRFEDGDAVGFLRDCIVTRSAERGTGSMNPGFSDSALDRLVEENAQTIAEPKRLRQYGELMQRLMEQMPLVPLYNRSNLYAVSTRVKWEPRLDGVLRVSEMSIAPLEAP